MSKQFAFLSLVALIPLAAGCSGGDLTDVPEGWATAEARWWREPADTAKAFRNLESLQAMGVAEGTQVFAMQPAQLTGAQLRRSVKESLIRLYRNAPQVIDSLFARYVASDLAAVTISGDVQQRLEELKAEYYGILRRHFREPRTRTTLGEDVAVVFPDSLRQQGVSGEVRMQVYLNEEGVPQAIELLEGLHPTLDAIALHATTQMRWEPAYVEVDGQWEAIPSWVRFNINFRQPPA